MSDLVAFLKARLDEDVRGSQPQPEQRWSGGWHESDCSTYDYNVLDCDCALPARTLREVEAKRAIIELHVGDHECPVWWDNPAVDGPPSRTTYVHPDFIHATDPTLRLLALPYSDHPDYDQEWGKP